MTCTDTWRVKRCMDYPACRRSAPRQQRHSHLNDILWTAIKRAQMPAVKEPISLMRDDNKRPDGTTLLPWARGKPMAWDMTVPDTYAESHTGNTATKPGAAAQKTAQNKIDKYSKLANIHTHSSTHSHNNNKLSPRELRYDMPPPMAFRLSADLRPSADGSAVRTWRSCRQPACL